MDTHPSDEFGSSDVCLIRVLSVHFPFYHDSSRQRIEQLLLNQHHNHHWKSIMMIVFLVSDMLVHYSIESTVDIYIDLHHIASHISRSQPFMRSSSVDLETPPLVLGAFLIINYDSNSSQFSCEGPTLKRACAV